MKTFYCEEIACGGCAARIDRALDAAGIRHSVDLENKTVTVEETAGVAPEILFDLGLRRWNDKKIKFVAQGSGG